MANLIVSRAITRSWWVLALRGVAAMLLGLALIFSPAFTLLLLTVWLAAFMAVDGILAVVAGVSAVAHHRHGAALLAEGVLGLAVAIFLFVWPVAGIATLVALAAIWAVLTGVALLWAASALPVPGGRWIMGLAALLSIVLGVLLFVEPVAGALVLALWFGAYALASGAVMLGLAWHLRRAHGVSPAHG